MTSSIITTSPSISCFDSLSLYDNWICTIDHTNSAQPILHLLCFISYANVCIEQESIAVELKRQAQAKTSQEKVRVIIQGILSLGQGEKGASTQK